MRTFIILSIIVLAGCVTEPGNVAEPFRPRDVIATILGDEYDRLNLRIYYTAGRQPSSLALDALNETIQDIANKKSEIEIYREIPSESKDHSAADLNALEADLRNNEPNSSNYLRLVYLAGGTAIAHDSAGVYRSGGNIYVFLDQLDTDLLLGAQVKGLGINEFRPYGERSVLIHEFGHAIGLVNCGLPMTVPREDPESRCHSSEETSVMNSGGPYFSSHPTYAVQSGMEPIWRFSENDLADIRNYRAWR